MNTPPGCDGGGHIAAKVDWIPPWCHTYICTMPQNDFDCRVILMTDKLPDGQ